MTTDKHKYQGKMQNLDSVPYYEVQDAVNKIRRKREKNRLIREEMDRQVRLEHPTLAKWQPYLQVVGVIVGMAIFCIALWIIFQVNATNQVPV